MLPRCSLRHCKCLFASALVVCAVTALVAYKFKPGGNQPEARAITSSVLYEEEVKLTPDSIQFLAPTDAPQDTGRDEEEVLGKSKKSVGEVAEKVINSGPIFYNSNKDSIPNYDLMPAAAPRGDIDGYHFPGVVRPIGQQVPAHTYLSQREPEEAGVHNKKNEPPPFIPERRLIHFDLKGAPPRIDYLQQLIPIIAQLGGTGLLLEYEDMFPYEGALAPMAAANHYTKAEIKSLLQVAKAYKLEVIPLVQTFGHLEYVLKHPRFSQLRENPAVPQALCPSQNDSLLLVEHLVDQIMSLHEGVKFLHIGCDEVFHIAECHLCSQKPKDELFLNHVARVATYVRQKYKVIPIIWDDMLRHMTASTMEESQLGKLVEPMVWVYAEDVYRFAGSYVFDRYAQVFPTFWISSSFKGAFGETLVVPDVGRHLENNLNWLNVGRTESPKFKAGLRGIAITGWQRYDHFSNLCELLPAGVPSMAVNLLTTSRGYYNNSLAPKLYEALSCQRNHRYEKMPDLRTSRADRFLHEKMAMCFFPGAHFFKHTARFLRLEKEIEEFIVQTTKRKGWLTDYSVRHNYSSPARIDELLRDLPYLSGSLSAVARQTAETLKNIFDAHTVSEWMEQKILPLFEKIDRLMKDGAGLKARKNWPSRPLKLFDEWDQYGFRLSDYYNLTSGLPVTPPSRSSSTTTSRQP